MGDSENQELVPGEVEAEAPVPAAVDGILPLTSEQFKEAFHELIERGKAAGVRPFQVMASAYVRQGMSLIDSVLGSFEDDRQDEPKPKPKPKKK